MDNHIRFYRGVFRVVMTRYDELKSKQGSAFRNCTTSRVVHMLPEDFFADVEIAAKKALSPAEYECFTAVYLDKEFDADEKMDEGFKHNLQEKVGRMWQARGIFPVESYMKSVDCR